MSSPQIRFRDSGDLAGEVVIESDRDRQRPDGGWSTGQYTPILQY